MLRVNECFTTSTSVVGPPFRYDEHWMQSKIFIESCLNRDPADGRLISPVAARSQELQASSNCTDSSNGFCWSGLSAMMVFDHKRSLPAKDEHTSPLKCGTEVKSGAGEDLPMQVQHLECSGGQLGIGPGNARAIGGPCKGYIRLDWLKLRCHRVSNMMSVHLPRLARKAIGNGNIKTGSRSALLETPHARNTMLAVTSPSALSMGRLPTSRMFRALRQSLI